MAFVEFLDYAGVGLIIADVLLYCIPEILTVGSLYILDNNISLMSYIGNMCKTNEGTFSN